MPLDSPRHFKEVYMDCMHDNIGTAAGDGIEWINSSDGGDTAFAVGARAGGTARGATAATDDNLIELSHGLVAWRPQDGEAYSEHRFQLDVITNVAVNCGWNDDALDDSNTLPAELATATWTSNATTFVGLVFDTDATNDDWHAFWVDDDTDSSTALATLRFQGEAWTAAQYYTFRTHLQDNGTGNQARATFSIVDNNGTNRALNGPVKEFSSTVDRDVLLTPYLGVENRSATAHQCDVSYIYAKMSLPTGLT